MPSIAKQRRAWFALLKEVGITDEDRHDVQEAHTGKRSLREWMPRDYDQAIAALQRAAGQHNDRHAHVREDRPPGCHPESGSGRPKDLAVHAHNDGWATPAQAAYIEDLCDQIEWKTGRQLGPYRYACHTVLKGPEKALRRKQLNYGQVARADNERAWFALTRQEASDLIKALKRLADVNPLPRWEGAAS